MTELPAYLRFPHVRADQVVFTADDDVWLGDVSGGRATRLTADRVPVARPKLSPDGSQVAWLSRRDGQPEIFVMPLDGGVATRLTYWGLRSTRLLGWSADGRVLAAGAINQPFPTYAWAYALPVDGEPGERLPYGPLSGLAIRGDGPGALQSVIFREAADWKRYRGGTAAKLWLDATGDGVFAPFLRELDGQLTDPAWIGERLVFVSDHEGHGNVYSVRVDGTDLRRHSDHTGMYARNLSGDGTRATYQREGSIWLVGDLAADSVPTQLDFTIPGARSGRLPVTHNAAEALGELRVDATGRASAVELRGTVQWVTHLDGPVRALADTPGARARMPRIAGLDGSVVWITDADGDDALEVSAGSDRDAEVRRLAGGQLGRVLELEVAPDGASAAVATHDGRVLVVTLADGTVRELERYPDGDVSGLAFSPDSAWLAWSAPQGYPMRSIKLAALTEPADGVAGVLDVTPVRFVDTEPAFTPDGLHLAFLSARTFDPVYDAHNFELGFPVGTRPYLVPLAATTASPFEPELAGRFLAGSETPEGGSEAPETAPVAASDAPQAAATAAPTPPAPPRVTVDREGLVDRVVAVPVAAGLLSDLTAAKGGLLWLEHAITGVIGAGLPPAGKPPRGVLQRWDFAKRSAAQIAADIDGYAVSGDGTRVVLRDGEELRVAPADHKVEDPAPGEVVTVDLSRVRVVSDPGSEWRQMTAETWRLMRDHFWVEDMAGVDWDDALRRYLPVVDRLATRDELSELLWELIAELGTSHAYERPKAAEPPAGRAAAFLGADLGREADGLWRVVRVLPGESSVPAARSPLAAPGVGVVAGDVLRAVNGRPVGPAGPAPLLAGMADKPVELTVEHDGARRSVVVVPVADEAPLRYQAWVADRRAYVHELSNGRAGYVHVPDMVATGWAEFNRDLRVEVAKDALVVDTRENGGGHTSELVIERLARRIVGWQSGRYRPAGSYPSDAPRGPMVSIANEMAGSDGDIVNQAFKSLALGPIVGTRTWGGVIGIDGVYSLVDGSVVTQPRYPFWFVDVGWGVENHGVDPDVEVARPPQAWVADSDPQLDEGVRLITEALQTHQPVRPADVTTRPSRRPPELGPRP